MLGSLQYVCTAALLASKVSRRRRNSAHGGLIRFHSAVNHHHLLFLRRRLRSNQISRGFKQYPAVFFKKVHKIKSRISTAWMSFLFRLIVMQVWNSHHQTCGASGWKWSKGTGCFPPPPSGSLSRFAGTVSLPSDWSSRCSLEDRDAGARLPGNSRHGFGSIALLKILRNYCGNNKNLSLKTLICFWWAKN